MYEKNTIYRQDILGCYMSAFFSSLGHSHLYDRLDLLDVFKNTNLKNALRYFKKMYDVDTSELKRITTMNYNLRNCKIVNIYSKFDPIIQRYYNKQYYKHLIRKVLPEIRKNIKNISFPMITHCSQMFDDNKKNDFINLLRENIL